MGGIVLDELIKIPDGTEEELEDFHIQTMEDFVGPRTTKELAAEVKIATISFQWVPNGESSYNQVGSCCCGGCCDHW